MSHSPDARREGRRAVFDQEPRDGVRGLGDPNSVTTHCDCCPCSTDWWRGCDRGGGLRDPHRGRRRSPTIGGIRTRVLESDGGGSTVLLIHGYSDSADGWRAVMDTLADAGHRAVAVDLPHHGRAERPTGASFFGVVDDFVAAAVEKFGDGTDVVLVGNSVGGTSALRVAPAGRFAVDCRARHRPRRPGNSHVDEAGSSRYSAWPAVARAGQRVSAEGHEYRPDAHQHMLSPGRSRAGRMSADARSQYASHWGPGDLRRQLLLGGADHRRTHRPGCARREAVSCPRHRGMGCARLDQSGPRGRRTAPLPPRSDDKGAPGHRALPAVRPAQTSSLNSRSSSQSSTDPLFRR